MERSKTSKNLKTLDEKALGGYKPFITPKLFLEDEDEWDERVKSVKNYYSNLYPEISYEIENLRVLDSSILDFDDSCFEERITPVMVISNCGHVSHATPCLCFSSAENKYIVILSDHANPALEDICSAADSTDATKITLDVPQILKADGSKKHLFLQNGNDVCAVIALSSIISSLKNQEELKKEVYKSEKTKIKLPEKIAKTFQDPAFIMAVTTEQPEDLFNEDLLKLKEEWRNTDLGKKFEKTEYNKTTNSRVVEMINQKYFEIYQASKLTTPKEIKEIRQIRKLSKPVQHTV